ncbi:hypothetical protein [Flavobacterium hercynium]|uniref:Uncharacterized protein n=1 Tax=Flavobacterium hercynium TaxID=387094 RepID=A0A226HKV3_9FLAO|nr:hypothetical protein [Flavobacterium hercynium]OXA94815.1 hypothetical protein B0A66_03540 [Flavobacterium hercynium]SMP08086.1 hypothetical protein SAMN06265346_102138 [Flavobacterium hercynium]
MIKKLLFVSLLLNSLFSFSQNIVKEFDLKLNNKRDFFQIVNEDKKEVILFLNDKEKVTSFRFDEKFNIQDSLTSSRPEKKYIEIIGYHKNINDYFVFWGSKDRKEINSQYFNFATKETKTILINLELKKERLIKAITINNKFYLITIVKNMNILKFYVSDENGNLNEKIVDLSNLKSANNSDQNVNLHNILLEESKDQSMEIIHNDSPPSLALSSKKFKIYTYKSDEIIFTSDYNTDLTTILKINLNDFSANLKSIEQPKMNQQQFDSNITNSNSFLIDDKILQIKIDFTALILTISDQNGNKINQYQTLREEEISYKNSDVFQETGSIHNRRVLEKPKQFIRKMNNSNPGISCYKLNGLYYTVIGSCQDIAQNGSMAIGQGFGVGMGTGFGGSLSFGFTPNYTITNLISYQDKKVVYTNCLFDSNFNHLTDKITISAFERARIFVEVSEEIKEASPIFSKSRYKDLIIFKFNKDLYIGNYNDYKKKYQFFRFTE